MFPESVIYRIDFVPLIENKLTSFDYHFDRNRVGIKSKMTSFSQCDENNNNFFS